MLAEETTDDASALSTVRTQISQVRDWLDKDYRQRHKLEKELSSLQSQITALRQDLRNIDTQLAQAEAELQTVQRRYQRELDAHRTQLDALAVLLKAAYLTSRQPQLKLLLEAQATGKLGRLFTYYGYLHTAQAAEIQTLTASLETVFALERDVTDQAAALEQLQARRQADEIALHQRGNDSKQLLAALNVLIQDRQQSLKTLREEEAALARVVQGLIVTAPLPQMGEAPLVEYQGQLPWPVSQGTIRHHFGSARHSERLSWKGVMIDLPDDDEVRAIYAGRVVFADWMRGFGLLLIVDHGEGLMSLYGQNERISKNVGDWVEGGESIAFVTKSGRMGDPGLYFEIRQAGEPVDPLDWCQVGGIA